MFDLWLHRIRCTIRCYCENKMFSGERIHLHPGNWLPRGLMGVRLRKLLFVLSGSNLSLENMVNDKYCIWSLNRVEKHDQCDKEMISKYRCGTYCNSQIFAIHSIRNWLHYHKQHKTIHKVTPNFRSSTKCKILIFRASSPSESISSLSSGTGPTPTHTKASPLRVEMSSIRIQPPTVQI